MSMKDYPEGIVSIVRKISSAEDLQSFFETLSGKPEADAKTAYELFYRIYDDGRWQRGRTFTYSERVTRLAVSPAVSYLNANYAAIADTVKDQGAYGKGIAEGLLSDSRTLVRNATDMKDILAAFKYAFQAGSVIADAVRQLDDIASAFRAGERKLPDIFAIVRTVESAPWAVQKVFLEAEQNADIADLVRQAHTREFERQIFEDRVAAGGELFRKTGFADRVEELQDVVQELAQAEEEYTAAQARFFDYTFHRADWEESKMSKVFRELRNKIELLEKKKEEIFQGIKKKMIKQSSISHADAVKWVKDNVTFTESANRMILSRWYNIVKPSASDGNNRTLDTVKEELNSVCRNINAILDKIKSELADIYRLTNGQINHVTINLAELNMSYDRAMACKEGNTIILPKADFGALYHEAGHIFEYENPCFLGPALCFLRDRCTDGLQELADLVKKAELAKRADDDDDESYYSDYGEDELAFSGRFSHPSVGWLYAGATEVLSCGLGIFGDAERFLRGIEDMEHLKFCFGCFASGPANCIELPDEDGIIKKAGIAGKTAAWTEALDNAMPDFFAESLFSQEGVACFQVVEKVTLDQNGGLPCLFGKERHLITAKLLKYFGRVIAQKNDSDDVLTKFARMAYLGICNFKELIPDAGWPINNGDYLDTLSCNPPQWYTTLTKLPRL